jgi:predicted acyl esterase
MRNIYSITRPTLPVGIKLDENEYVTMRDGVRIAVDVYRPEAKGRYPALLSTSPYLKDMQQQPPELSHSIEAGATSFFVNKGYVHVIAQVRGSGLSQGQYNWYDIAEQTDGYELVEWIARQPWCNENVGMLGDSYFGTTQWLIAAQQPPHLRCIAPYDAGMDGYRSRCEGGLIRMGFLGEWGLDTTHQCVWPGPVEGKLPPANVFADICSNPDDGPYYWERSAYTKLDKIKVPVLSLVSARSATHSRTQLWGYPLIRSPKKLIVLPFVGFYANVFLIRSRPLNELILNWFDYWLKGRDTGIMNMPPVAICDSATGEWRYENEYPLDRTSWTNFYLRSNSSGSAKKPPYGVLSTEPPGKEDPDSYITPECLHLVAAGKPVVAYATPPLKQDMRVWGPLCVILCGSSTTLDTAWFVKVGDVAPDGKVTLITQGHLKASYRDVDETKSRPGQPFHPYQNPVRPEPDTIYEYQIELTPIFYTFKKGHQVWMQVASEDFTYHALHHTVYTAEMLPVPAKNTIHHDSTHQSRLLLPIIPDAPIIKPIEPAMSQIKWPLAETIL